MTQEEKQLLLRDLYARLPYGVKGLHSEEFPEWFSKIYGKGTSIFIFTLSPDNLVYIITELDRVKPYLRPISSMTMEEQREYISVGRIMSPDNPSVLADWLNAHHFDYRGLIEKGLAIESPEGMYKTK